MDDSGFDVKSCNGQLGGMAIVTTLTPVRQQGSGRIPGSCTVKNVFTVMILVFTTLITYIGRNANAAVVGRLKVDFDINDQLAGLIQTCFTLCYVLASPLFGYLGDRYTRRYIMAVGLILNAGFSLVSSFIPSSSYMLLLVTRAFVGVGEAAFINICPTVISDMFIGRSRTMVFTMYQFAIPIGCGSGYMLAAAIAEYFDSWRWAYRITPPLLSLLGIVLVIYVREPPRGHSEGATHLTSTSFKEDLRYLLGIPSYILMAFAFTCSAFALGALTYWAVNLINRAFIVNGLYDRESEIGCIFGIITIVAAVVGVSLGVVVSNKLLKPRIGPCADAIVCSVGMLISGPALYAALVFVRSYINITWVMIFIGITGLCIGSVLAMDITMTIVIATRRSTAQGIRMIVGHLLGDASSPYIIGVVSDHLQFLEGGGTSAMSQFQGLQRALLFNTFILVLSGCLFLFTSLYVNKDAENAKKLSKKLPERESMPSIAESYDASIMSL